MMTSSGAALPRDIACGAFRRSTAIHGRRSAYEVTRFTAMEVNISRLLEPKRGTDTPPSNRGQRLRGKGAQPPRRRRKIEARWNHTSMMSVSLVKWGLAALRADRSPGSRQLGRPPGQTRRWSPCSRKKGEPRGRWSRGDDIGPTGLLAVEDGDDGSPRRCCC